MYSAPRLAFKYLRYYLSSLNGRGHGTHSPFVFEFITEVLNDRRNFYSYQQIESVRQFLLHDERDLLIEDFGAGSRVIKKKNRKVSAIAHSSLKTKKIGQLLFRMADHYRPAYMLEIGSSLGITSSYLASADLSAKLVTLEGSPEVASIARETFSKLKLKNIELVEGNFDETLAKVLGTHFPQLDLAFIDGNHRYEPAIRYFQQLLEKSNDHTIILVDDIHWSKEMEEAWQWIQRHDEVTMTIDLFFIGIVFLRKEFIAKQHFTIRF